MSDERPARARTTLPPSLSESVPVPSGVRSQVDGDPQARLLSIALDAPIEQGVVRVARFTLEALEPLFPEMAVGVCIVDPNVGEQIVEVRQPGGSVFAGAHDPSRLFPAAAQERVFSLRGLGSSTFHVACDDPSRLESGAPESSLAQQAASLLESCIRRARLLDDAQRSESETKRLQAQVIQAEKLASLGRVVAGLVHELSNPLTSIIAYTDFLRRRLASGQLQGDELDRVERIGDAAQRILRFSRDLTAYARPAGDIPGAVLVEDIIERSLVFCEHELTKVSAQVDRRFDPTLPPVRGIHGQLTQVFVNLFTNAAHAMQQRGGILTITTRAGDGPGWVSIAVADDGSGIDGEVVDQIFEPFFTTKSDGKGTGLGLSIVRDIVQAHGGSVSVTSEPGRGTTFELTLPAAARPPTARPPAR